jgi:hypothetical protein
VAVWELLLWSLHVRQLEGRAVGRPAVAHRWAWRRLVVLDSHSAGDGAAVLGMVARRGDGHTEPMATEETGLTGLTSWRRPVRARDRCPYPFRGFHRPLSRVQRAGCTRVGGTVSRS